jgi:hypothetical protein
LLLDVATPKQIIQTADAVPAVSIGLHQEPMLPFLIGAAVLFGQEIDQQVTVVGMLAVQAD